MLTTVLLVLAQTQAVSSPDAALPTVTSAKIETALREARSTWISWTVDSVSHGVACCFNFDSKKGATRRQGCSLDGDDGGTVNVGGDATLSEVDVSRMRVFMRARESVLEKVAMFSVGCDVGSLAAIRDLGAATGAVSLSVLEKWGLTPRVRDEVVDQSLLAVSQHADVRASAILVDVAARRDFSDEIRKKAAFWLGVARGADGLAGLKTLRASWPATLKHELAFPISQSKAPGAVDELIDFAHNEPSAKARGQAIFWLSQLASKKAATHIRNATFSDQETEVQLQAVFGLSQLKDGVGLDDLIDVARTHQNLEVRKRAMFWIGQSKDPRALRFFTSVLTGK